MNTVFLITFSDDGTTRQIFQSKRKAVNFCKNHPNSEWEEWEYT